MDSSNFYRGNPKHGTKAERAATAEALRMLRQLLAAADAERAGVARPEGCTCAVFEPTFLRKGAEAEAARRELAAGIYRYLGSWVEPLLDAANGSMHGGTTLDQRDLLDVNVRENGWQS